MYLVKDITDIIEEFAPLETQFSYDKCGLKTGNKNQPALGVLVTLDLNENVVKEAQKKGCNLIVEHHPSIWTAWKEIDTAYPKTKALIYAASQNIAVYSAHTNIDNADGGLNDLFAKKIGLTAVKKLPFGRMGLLEKEMTVEEFATIIGKKINDKNIKIIGNNQKKLLSIAVINGAGGGEEETILKSIEAGCDALVTAEVKYNVARLSKDIGYAIIEVGHYTSEIAFNDLISSLIRSKLNDFPVFSSETLENPYCQ